MFCVDKFKPDNLRNARSSEIIFSNFLLLCLQVMGKYGRIKNLRLVRHIGQYNIISVIFGVHFYIPLFMVLKKLIPD